MIEAIICLLAIAMVGRIPISKGGSIRTLLVEARKKNLDILVLIDADSQHNLGTALTSVLFRTIGIFAIFTGMVLNILARRKQ